MGESILRISWDKCEDVGIVTHYKGKPFSGICYGLHNNGKIEEEHELVNGLKHGKGKWYHENGQLESEGEWVKDKQCGIWTYYNDKGQEIGTIDCTNMTQKEILTKETELSFKDFYEKNPERREKDLEFFRELHENTEQIEEDTNNTSSQKNTQTINEIVSNIPGLKTKIINLIKKYNLEKDKDYNSIWIFFDYDYDGLRFEDDNDFIKNEENFLNFIILNVIKVDDYYESDDYDIHGQISYEDDKNLKIYLSVHYDVYEDPEDCRNLGFEITDEFVKKIKDDDNSK